MQIIETVQRNLGFTELKKIDPNTQETAGVERDMGNMALAQAGIPAILLGLYNRLEENPDIDLFTNLPSGGLLDAIFGRAAKPVVQKIKEYSLLNDEHDQQQLEHIAMECVRVLKERIGALPGEKAVRQLVASNKQETLLYLPPSLGLGTILQNDNLDDRTGKMEGPVSSFMKQVGKAFNTTIGS